MSIIPTDGFDIDDLLKQASRITGTPPKKPRGRADALRRAAERLGVDAGDLGGIIEFESGSNPHKVGGEGGRYKGLIQFGPDEQSRYYRPTDTYESQVENGVVRYFEDRFKKVGRSTQGATLEDLYTTVIAGNPNANRTKTDSFGTSARSGAARIAKEFRPKIIKTLFGGNDTVSPKFDIDDLLTQASAITSVPIDYNALLQQAATVTGDSATAKSTLGTATPTPPTIASQMPSPPGPEKPPLIPRDFLERRAEQPITITDEEVVAEPAPQPSLYDRVMIGDAVPAPVVVKGKKPLLPRKRGAKIKGSSAQVNPTPLPQAYGEATVGEIDLTENGQPASTSTTPTKVEFSTVIPRDVDKRAFIAGEIQQKLADRGISAEIDDIQTAIGQLGWVHTGTNKPSDEYDIPRDQQINFTLDERLIDKVNKAREVRETQTKARGAKLIEYSQLVEAYRKQLTPDEPTSVASLKAARDLGGVLPEEFDKRYAEEMELAKRLRSEVALTDSRSLAMAAETGSSDRRLQDEYLTSILKEHDTLADYKQEQDRLRQEYKYRPLAHPIEFAKNFGGAVPKAVAAILKTADINLNVHPLKIGVDAASGRGFKMDETVLTQIGDNINQYLKNHQNQDLKDNLFVTLLPDTLGQLGVQIAAGVLTGGATLPTLIGASQGAANAYDDARKFKATDKQKLAASLVGALAAVPDAVLFGKWFKGASDADKAGFFQNLSKSLMARLGVKYGDDAAREVVQSAMPRITVNVLKGAGFEGPQEVLENKANDLLASQTYDPSPGRQKKLSSITDDDIAGFIGGAIGGGTAGAVFSFAGQEKEFGDKLDTRLDQMLKAGDITPEDAQTAKDRFAQAVDDADKGSGKDIVAVPKKENKPVTTDEAQIRKPAASVEPDEVLPPSEKQGEDVKTVTHPNPAIDGKPVIAETDSGKVVVANSENKSGVSVVTDRTEDVSQINRDAASISPWMMGPAEIDQELKRAKSEDQGRLDELFGPEGAKRYQELQRKANSQTAPIEKINEAVAELGQMEEALTEEQRNRLFGIGEEGVPQIDDWKDYQTALSKVDTSSEDAIGRSLKYAITAVGEKTDPSKMKHSEQVAYAQIRHAMQSAVEQGFDTQKITKVAVKAAADRWKDPADVELMLGKFIKKDDTKEVAQSTSPQPETSEPNIDPVPVETEKTITKKAKTPSPKPSKREQRYAESRQEAIKKLQASARKSKRQGSPDFWYPAQIQTSQGNLINTADIAKDAGLIDAGLNRYALPAKTESTKKTKGDDISESVSTPDDQKEQAQVRGGGGDASTPRITGGNEGTEPTRQEDAKASRPDTRGLTPGEIAEGLNRFSKTGDLRKYSRRISNMSREEKVRVVENLRAGDDPLTAIKDAKGYNEPITKLHGGFPFLESLFGSRAKPDSINTKILLEDADAEVEQRMSDAEGIKVSAGVRRIIENAKSSVGSLTKAFRRTFPQLDPNKDATHAVANDLFRQLSATPAWAKALAADKLAYITENLGPDRMKVFTRALILPDIIKDIENGLYTTESGKLRSLPFGFRTKEQVEQSLQKYLDIANSEPSIKDALKRRETFNRELTQQLVDLGLLEPEVLKDERYFHRQVMSYVSDPAFVGTGGHDARVHKKGFQKERTGGGDFNTSYIEAEHEWVAQAYSLINRREILNRIKAAADVKPDLMLDAKIQSAKGKKVEWSDLIPEGYTVWQPERGNYFYPATSVTERALDKILGLGAPVQEKDVRKILARGGAREQWVVPDGIAYTLDNFSPPTIDNPIENLWTSAQASWKQWALINPLRILRYNLNNTSGDMDIALAYDPSMLKDFRKAARDLWRYQVSGKVVDDIVRDEIQDAIKRGVVDSGLSISEIPDINRVGAFKVLTSENPNLLQKGIEQFWGGSKTFTNWRENILRLAAYRYFKRKVESGKAVYGASTPKQIDAIPDPNDKAAKLARELIGDYGAISVAGQWIRRHLIPFYSWIEINAPRYARMLRNVPFEEGKGKGLRTGGVIAGKSTVGLVKLGVKAHILAGLAMLWNQLMFPEEEKKLRKEERRKGHIIIGVTEEGQPRTLRIEGALSDALEWFGGEDYLHDIQDVAKGDATVGDKAAEAVKAPINKIVNAWEPASKTTFELVMGKSAFPNIFEKGSDMSFKGNVIRDRTEYVARLFSLDALYRRIVGRPRRPSDTDPLGAFLDWTITYRSDPGETAYWEARGKVADYQKARGKESQMAEPTDRANALYYYKQAVRWGDEAAAEKYLKEYHAFGGTDTGLEQSVKRAHPLGGLAQKDWIEYVESLNEEKRAELITALHYYNKTYQASGDGEGGNEGDVYKLLFAKPLETILKPSTTIQQGADLIEKHSGLSEDQKRKLKIALQRRVQTQAKAGNLTEEERQAAERIGLPVPTKEKNNRRIQKKELRDRRREERRKKRLEQE